jgi:pimeloyl-ACP methyl ester carboxylesterase
MECPNKPEGTIVVCWNLSKVNLRQILPSTSSDFLDKVPRKWRGSGVGHSYGAIGALCAAALRPQAVRSLTVNEPPAFRLARGDAAADTVAARREETMRDLHELRAFLGSVRSRHRRPGAREMGVNCYVR